MKYKLSLILIALLVVGSFLQAKDTQRFVTAKVIGKYYSNITFKYYNVDVKVMIDHKKKTVKLYFPEKECPYYKMKAEEYNDYCIYLDEKGVSELRSALKKCLQLNIQYKDNEVEYQKIIAKIPYVLYFKTKNKKKWKHGKVKLKVYFISKLGKRWGTIFPRNYLCFCIDVIYANGVSIAGSAGPDFFFKDVKKLVEILDTIK